MSPGGDLNLSGSVSELFCLRIEYVPSPRATDPPAPPSQDEGDKYVHERMRDYVLVERQWGSSDLDKLRIPQAKGSESSVFLRAWCRQKFGRMLVWVFPRLCKVLHSLLDPEGSGGRCGTVQGDV